MNRLKCWQGSPNETLKGCGGCVHSILNTNKNPGGGQASPCERAYSKAYILPDLPTEPKPPTD